MELDATPLAPAPLKQRGDKQPSAEVLPQPVAVHVVDGHGYVWDADDARRLRQDHRIVGAMIGAVAGFKQQNAASGLPLRLLPEELALALDRGWVRGYRLRGEGEGECSNDGGGEARKRLLAAAAADPFLGDAAAGGGGGGGGEDGGDGGSGDGGSKRKEKDPSSSSSASCWREALERGTHLTLATAAPESLRVYFDSSAASASSSGPDEKSDKKPMLKRRPRPGSCAAASHAVFRDLHSRGYCLTPGANFGAHWLAYPSDPMLYHAQLCVRVCSGAAGEEEEEEEEGEEGEEGQSGRIKGSSSSSSSAAASTPLCPTLLAAASRGAHAARKHLLLAYPSNGTEGEGEASAVVHYLTIAPEAGFG